MLHFILNDLLTNLSVVFMREYLNDSIDILNKCKAMLEKQKETSEISAQKINLISLENKLKELIDYENFVVRSGTNSTLSLKTQKRIKALCCKLFQSIGEVRFYKGILNNDTFTVSERSNSLYRTPLENNENSDIFEISLKYPVNKSAFSSPPFDYTCKFFTAPPSFHQVLLDLYKNLTHIYINFQYFTYPKPSNNLQDSLNNSSNEINSSELNSALRDFNRDIKLIGDDCFSTAEKSNDEIEQAIKNFVMVALLKSKPDYKNHSVSEILNILRKNPTKSSELENEGKDLIAYIKSRGGQHFTADGLNELEKCLEFGNPEKYGRDFGFPKKTRKLEWSINNEGEIEFQMVITPFAVHARNIPKNEFKENYPAYLAIDNKTKNCKYLPEIELGNQKFTEETNCQPLAQLQTTYVLKRTENSQNNKLGVKLELKSNHILLFSELLTFNKNYLDKENLESEQPTINFTK